MLNLTPEERDDLRKTFETSTGNWFELALKVADRAVFLFLARASGQVKEDARALELTIDHACEDDEWEAKYSSTDRAALTRLAALAQEAESLRAKVALKDRLLESVTAQREELKGAVGAARAEAERLKSALSAEKEAHEREKRERERNWADLRAARAEMDTLKSRCDVLRERSQTAESEMLRYRQEVERLQKALALREADVSLHFEAKNAALAEVSALQAKVAELEKDTTDWRRAAGQESLDRQKAEQERNTARAEVERLKAAMDDCREAHRLVFADWKAAESRLAAIRERAKDTEEIRRRFAEALQSFCTHDAAVLVVASWVWEADGLEGDAPQEAKAAVAILFCSGCYCERRHEWKTRGTEAERWRCEACGLTHGACRYPCSATCTHDDAANPGHPERKGEAAKAMRPNVSCTCAGEGTCSWCDKVSQPCGNCEKLKQQHDFLANEIAKMGPIAKDLLAAQARVAELEEQLVATQKERDASDERAHLWFTELVALRKEKTEALQIAGNASQSSDLRGVMRQKQAVIADLSESAASYQSEAAKYRKRVAKWKRRAQKAALDFYEGFLIGHRIGQAAKKETPP